jgi:hypothetical protein
MENGLADNFSFAPQQRKIIALRASSHHAPQKSHLKANLAFPPNAACFAEHPLSLPPELPP